MNDIIIENINIEEDNFVLNTINEASSRFLFPQQLNSKSARRRLYEECGSKAFINPRTLEYPVINPKTCDYDCNMINKAYYELHTLNTPGSSDMRQDIKQLINDVGCKKHVIVKLQDDVEMDLDLFIHYFND